MLGSVIIVWSWVDTLCLGNYLDPQGSSHSVSAEGSTYQHNEDFACLYRELVIISLLCKHLFLFSVLRFSHRGRRAAARGFGKGTLNLRPWELGVPGLQEYVNYGQKHLELAQKVLLYMLLMSR